jgi:hypothetical protein
MNFFHTQLGFIPSLEASEWDWIKSSNCAVVLDTETMGSAENIEVTEITAKTLCGETVIDYLVLPEETTKHKKLFASDKKRIDAGIKLPIRRHWQDIHSDIKLSLKNKLIIAYGAGFDRRVLTAQIHYKFPPDPIDERGWRCLMPLTRKFFGLKKNPSLSEACRLMNEHLGIAPASDTSKEGWHTASWDVDQTIKLLHFLMDNVNRSKV